MAKFEYMERVFSSGLKPRARLVLQVLVLHCNKEGECFPSIKTIAAKCGYGVSTVKRALDELVKAGYIVKQARFDERKNGGQTSNLYTLCSDLPCPDEPENVPVPEDDASDESPAVQPESAPADACNASDPTPGEQSATLPKKRMKLKMPFPLCLIPRLGSSLPSFCSLPILFHMDLIK